MFCPSQVSRPSPFSMGEAPLHQHRSDLPAAPSLSQSRTSNLNPISSLIASQNLSPSIPHAAQSADPGRSINTPNQKNGMSTNATQLLSKASATVKPAANNVKIQNFSVCENWKKMMELAQISQQSAKQTHYHAHMAVKSARSSLPAKPLFGAQGLVNTPPGLNPLGFDDFNSPYGITKPVTRITGESEQSTSTEQGSSNAQQNESSWTALDISATGIRTLSLQIFKYNFLTHLYLAHNHLQKVPKGISALSKLVHLDLSDNQISTLSTELAKLTNLRELLLFDNMISIIPCEFGSLYHLEILGIEGNPLLPAIQQHCMEEGTASFISLLRDTSPVPSPPPARIWKTFENSSNGHTLNAVDFTLLTYNILCNKMATAQVYGYTPSWALTWSYRKELILKELLNYKADIICLQEVDVASFDDFFTPQLAAHGYQGFLFVKSRARTMTEQERKIVDGCATFYKKSKFNLLQKQLVEFNQANPLKRQDHRLTEDMYNRVMTKDNVSSIALFESTETEQRFVLTNAHLYWDPSFKDVKVVQVAMLMDEIIQHMPQFNSLPSKLKTANDKKPSSSAEFLPTIICGDFNSTPDSGVCEFLSTGKIPPDHSDLMDYEYGDYTNGKTHSFELQSTYGLVGELPFTNFTPGFTGAIDHIWHTLKGLDVKALLLGIDENYLQNFVGFPNAHFPSDHICLMAEFRLRGDNEGFDEQRKFDSEINSIEKK